MVSVRFSESEAARIDKARGSASRAEYVRAQTLNTYEANLGGTVIQGTGSVTITGAVRHPGGALDHKHRGLNDKRCALCMRPREDHA